MKALCLLTLFTCVPSAYSVEENESDNADVQYDTEVLVVEGRRVNLVGSSQSASEGIVGKTEILQRPMLRTGEILETVPGLVVTQHSGTGKANQYFLRGFNLDHGTDFATSIDGMPINMRTHGHGQGYTDLNFLIEETINQIAYKKGPYYADVGDFSGAGSAQIETSDRVEQGFVEFTVGEDNYREITAIDSFEGKDSDWLYALNVNTYDGPWTDIEEDLSKKSVLLKNSRSTDSGDWDISVMLYDNSWNSADQIPQRAVTQGIIDELGSLDTTVGGESSRYSLNVQWENDNLQANIYAISYDLNLWSNFTYFLDDEVNGDQFEQVDERSIYGGSFKYLEQSVWGGKTVNHESGLEVRYDDIDEVGLYKSLKRQRLGAIRSDAVDELSVGIFYENTVFWTSNLRSVVGLRYDYYDFDVNGLINTNVNNVDLSTNSGKADDDILSAKGSLIYSFSDEWETYISAGQGFHSNDARGTTVNIDPIDGSSINTVDPLVRSFGYELGVRGFVSEKLNTSFSVWSLELDSELLFVGDAGNTEANGATQRYGFEMTAYYRLDDTWSLDLEYAYTDAKFSDIPAGQGDEVPGAIEKVLQAGVSANFDNGWFTSARLRYFGDRPLTETGDVRSDSSTLANFRLGYRYQNWTLKADVLNAFDSNDHDIDYYYGSRLASEPSGSEIEDLHYHVLEPRTIRLSAAYHF